MTSHNAYICAGCPGDGSALADALRDAAPEGWAIHTHDCLSGCQRPVSAAFRAPGKTAYLFGEIGQADLADIHRFMALYAASQDGTFADARVLGPLRLKAIARIPGDPA